MRKTVARKLHRAEVAFAKGNACRRGELRKRFAETAYIARQHHRLGVQIVFSVDPRKAFQKPFAEEAGSPRDEYPRPAQLIPQTATVCNNVLEVVLQGMRHERPRSVPRYHVWEQSI